MVDVYGVRPDPEAVEVVLTWKAPRTDTQLMSNYNREFVKGYTDKVYPMQKLMRNKGKKFEWNEEAHAAFEKMKQELCEAPVLGMPTEKGILSLLDKRVQVTRQVMQMLGEFLEREVTGDDPEWAAAMASLTKEVVRTDLQPFRQETEPLAKICCVKMEDDTQQPDETNSHLRVMKTYLKARYRHSDLLKGQRKDRMTSNLKRRIEIGTPDKGDLEEDSYRILRQYFMQKEGRLYLNKEGIVACKRKEEDKVKDPRELRFPLQSIDPSEFNEVVQIGHQKILMTDSGYNQVLVMIDRFTKYAEALPCITASAEETCDHLINTWIARHGCPMTFKSANGTAFVGKLTKELIGRSQVAQALSTTYHPQTNGLVERQNRTIVPEEITVSQDTDIVDDQNEEWIDDRSKAEVEFDNEQQRSYEHDLTKLRALKWLNELTSDPKEASVTIQDRDYKNIEFLWKRRPGIGGIVALPPAASQIPGKYLCFLVTRATEKRHLDPENLVLSLTRLGDFLEAVYDPNRGRLSPRE
ncbi:uncharacterized protein LOC134854826 [Symsagittifera roscoffensis]|uniref:uncharacterized protein LOC134854826 n=1 Tax=Symsagittifera roscoffensis TaxID=84072 RepID=UPI00307C53AE